MWGKHASYIDKKIVYSKNALGNINRKSVRPKLPGESGKTSTKNLHGHLLQKLHHIKINKIFIKAGKTM